MKADILTKTWIAAILAIFCSALWGSAFPCVKIGYGLFGVDTSQPMSLILFAGIRFFAAGIMVIITGSIMHKKPLVPKIKELPKVAALSLTQTILQYLFFYIGLANTSGVKSSVIEGMSVFVCILISSLVFRLEKLTKFKIIGCVLGTAGIVVINLDRSLLSGFSLTGDGFILLSTIAYAISSVLIKRFSKDTDTMMLSGWQFLLGGHDRYRITCRRQHNSARIAPACRTDAFLPCVYFRLRLLDLEPAVKVQPRIENRCFRLYEPGLRCASFCASARRGTAGIPP